MRWLIFAVSVSALAASAAVAQSMQIHGVTGYLSEYDLSADVSGEASALRANDDETNAPLEFTLEG